MNQGMLNVYGESDVVTKQGSRRTILWNNTMLRDFQGTIIGVTSIGQDITEQKWVEEALRKSERRYRNLFEKNLAGVYRTTTDGAILDCNEAYAKALGFTPCRRNQAAQEPGILSSSKKKRNFSQQTS